MNNNMRPASPRPSASIIPIVDESLTSYSHESQPYASFRAIDDVESHQPLQNATQAQHAIALGSNAHAVPDHGMALLQSADHSFQQPNYDGLIPDAPNPTEFAGQLDGMRLIPDPPDLDYWRQKLFNVDDVILLSEEQYATL